MEGVSRGEYDQLAQRFAIMEAEAKDKIARLESAIQVLQGKPAEPKKDDLEIPMRDIIPEQFSGNNRSEFAEWAETSVLYITKVGDTDQAALLEWCARQETAITGEMLQGLANERKWADVHKIAAFGKALYKYVYMKTSGPARQIVRNGQKHDGYDAWRRLFAEYDPKLITGAQGHLKAALSMNRAKSIGEVSVKVQELEEHIRQYEDCQKIFDPDIKIQKLYDIIPVEAEKQLLLERKARGESQTYAELVSRINSWVLMSQSGPKPMDTSALATGEREEEEKETEGEWPQDKGSEWSSYPVSEQSADLCGMYWNKGGKGKGEQKGSKGSGKSKGFQGECWNCGEFGHSAKNCRSPKGKGKGKSKGKGKGKGKGGWFKGKGAYALGWNQESYGQQGWEANQVGHGGFYPYSVPTYEQSYEYGVPALALTVGHRKAQPETTTVQKFDFANCTLASPLDLALGDATFEDFDDEGADDDVIDHAAGFVSETFMPFMSDDRRIETIPVPKKYLHKTVPDTKVEKETADAEWQVPVKYVRSLRRRHVPQAARTAAEPAPFHNNSFLFRN